MKVGTQVMQRRHLGLPLWKVLQKPLRYDACYRPETVIQNPRLFEEYEVYSVMNLVEGSIPHKLLDSTDHPDHFQFIFSVEVQYVSNSNRRSRSNML